MEYLEQLIINYDKKLIKANKEIERLNKILKKAKECLNQFKNTDVEDYAKIIELYKEMDSILNNKDN